MQPYIGSVMSFGFGTVPSGWLQCNGQLLQISTNETLYSLLSTTYGGDGVSTFALPDLRSRVPIGTGQGSGLQKYSLGQSSGNEYVMLMNSNLAEHNHAGSVVIAAGATSDSNDPTNNVFGLAPVSEYGTAPLSTPVQMAQMGGISDVSGNSTPFDIHNPLLGLNYCIATVGIYPSR